VVAWSIVYSEKEVVAKSSDSRDEDVPTKIDGAASDACTRSGAFALLLSLALLSVIPYWWDRQDNVALGRYVALRLTLKTDVDLLDGDVFWQKYKSSNDAAESAPISSLVKIQVEETPPEANTLVLPRKTIATNRKISPPTAATGAPAAPIGLRAIVTTQIGELQQIADTISQLDDSDLLTRSRSTSVFYNLGIYRWALKRNSLVNRDLYARACQPKGIQGSQKGQQREYYVPALGRELLLDCLTLHDIRELADFELPIIPDTTKFGVRGEREVDVSPGALPRDLYLASLFAQVVMICVIVYFNAFVREAVSSRNFPAQGTLFGAFSRSRWTLGAFAVSLSVPFVASTAVAALSRRWVLTVCAVLIGCVVASTITVLQRKSYWDHRGFRFLTRGKGLAQIVTKDQTAISEGPTLPAENSDHGPS
jgi:hypothetical protein